MLKLLFVMNEMNCNLREKSYYQPVALMEGDRLILASSLCEELVREFRRDLRERHADASGNNRRLHRASVDYERFGDFLWEQRRYLEAWRMWRLAINFCMDEVRLNHCDGTVPVRQLRLRMLDLADKIRSAARGHEWLEQLVARDKVFSCCMRCALHN